MISAFTPPAGAFARYGKLQGFAFDDGGRRAGSLAAIANPRLLGRTGAPLGQIGYFDCEDDEAVSRALFGAALDWLAAQGAHEVVGPMNGGAHTAHRLLVSGFETEPFLNEPRNPAHYPRLWEAAGFQALRRWTSYDIGAAALAETTRRLVAGAERAGAGERFSVEPGAPRDVEPSLRRIHAILDAVWAGHTGYAPLDLEEMVEGFTGLLGVMSERHLAFLVDRGTGRDAGIAFVYPDVLVPLRIVMHTVAVVPEARRTGGPHLLMAHLFRNAVEDGFQRAVIALVDEDFRYFGKFLEATRVHALYARGVSRTTPA